MSYYKNHVFFRTNHREDGSQCCAQYNAQEMRDYMKKRSKELGLVSKGEVRVNSAGCLNCCELGLFSLFILMKLGTPLSTKMISMKLLKSIW